MEEIEEKIKKLCRTKDEHGKYNIHSPEIRDLVKIYYDDIYENLSINLDKITFESRNSLLMFFTTNEEFTSSFYLPYIRVVDQFFDKTCVNYTDYYTMKNYEGKYRIMGNKFWVDRVLIVK